MGLSTAMGALGVKNPLKGVSKSLGGGLTDLLGGLGSHSPSVSMPSPQGEAPTSELQQLLNPFAPTAETPTPQIGHSLLKELLMRNK